MFHDCPLAGNKRRLFEIFLLFNSITSAVTACNVGVLLGGAVVPTCQHETQQYIILICKQISSDYLLASLCIIFQLNHFTQHINTITK